MSDDAPRERSRFIEQHAVAIYFAVTFLLSWGGIVIMLGPGGLPATNEQMEKTGALAYLAMLVGPSVAGVLLTGLVSGRAGLRDLLARSLRWRVGARWYAAALLLIPSLAAAVPLALSRFSADFLPVIVTTEDKGGILLSGTIAGLMVGIFEEVGWTGFVVPRLRRRYSILSTGLMLGLVWGAWHFLLFWEPRSFFEALAFAVLLGRLFSWLPAARLLLVWVYSRTESVLAAMLMHAGLVATGVFIFQARVTGAAVLTFTLVWAAVMWAVVGVVALAGGFRDPPPGTAQPASKLRPAA